MRVKSAFGFLCGYAISKAKSSKNHCLSSRCFCSIICLASASCLFMSSCLSLPPLFCVWVIATVMCVHALIFQMKALGHGQLKLNLRLSDAKTHLLPDAVRVDFLLKVGLDLEFVDGTTRIGVVDLSLVGIRKISCWLMDAPSCFSQKSFCLSSLVGNTHGVDCDVSFEYCCVLEGEPNPKPGPTKLSSRVSIGKRPGLLLSHAHWLARD